MALFHRTDVELKDISRKVIVPNNPTAKLMYYLDCMCIVLKLDDDEDINRLRRFYDYDTLTGIDTNVLINLCYLLKPEVLLNKCIFQNDRLCGELPNKFYDLEEVRNNLLVAGSVMIGGQQKQVTKIMTFKIEWLHKYWLNPIQLLLERNNGQQSQCNVCVIL